MSNSLTHIVRPKAEMEWVAQSLMYPEAYNDPSMDISEIIWNSMEPVLIPILHEIGFASEYESREKPEPL